MCHCVWCDTTKFFSCKFLNNGVLLFNIKFHYNFWNIFGVYRSCNTTNNERILLICELMSSWYIICFYPLDLIFIVKDFDTLFRRLDKRMSSSSKHTLGCDGWGAFLEDSLRLKECQDSLLLKTFSCILFIHPVHWYLWQYIFSNNERYCIKWKYL